MVETVYTTAETVNNMAEPLHIMVETDRQIHKRTTSGGRFSGNFYESLDLELSVEDCWYS